MTDSLPKGHPIAWEDLVAYERDQGGYWLHGRQYEGGKVWVRVPAPEQPGEIIGYVNRLSMLVADVTRRAEETGNPQMAALAAELKRVRVPRLTSR